MSNLGKRYVALTPVLRFEESTDGPNYTQVARDENGKPIVDRHQLHHNGKLYEHEGIARREANAFAHRHRKDADGFGRVLEVDLDDLRDVDATDEDTRMRHERLWQHHYSAYLALTGQEPAEPNAVHVAAADRDAITDAIGDLAEDVSTPSLDYLRKLLDRLGLLTPNRPRPMARSSPRKLKRR